MLLLIGSDFLHVGVKRILHTGFDEVLLGVVLETLRVERGLEMLKGESIVEDVS